jgi:hypothetical protein
VTQRPNDPPWAAAPPNGELSLHERMAIQIERAQPDGAEFLDGLSDEDLGELAMAAAIEAELEEQDAAAEVPGVLPLRRPARPARVLNPRWVALAAVLAGVALIPFAWRGTQGGGVRVPSHAVAMLENKAAGLPEGWTDSIAWSGPRGGSGGSRTEPLPSSLDAVVERRRSVHLGAYLVDLDLAIRARDADQTRILADRAADLLNGVSGGGLAGSSFTQLASLAGGPPAEVLPDFREASESAALYVDKDLFALAAWAEAARLAAKRQDVAFFRETRTRRTLDGAKEIVGDNASAQAAIATIRAALEPESPQWTELETATADLLKAIG